MHAAAWLSVVGLAQSITWFNLSLDVREFCYVDTLRKATVSKPRVSHVVIPKQKFAVRWHATVDFGWGSATLLNVDFFGHLRVFTQIG
jgi:hypothetical protein